MKAKLSQSEDKGESSWSWLARAWVLGYLLPGLIAFAVAVHHQSEKRAEEDRIRQEQLQGVTEEMNKRVLEGTATEVDLILLGVDREEYEKYKRLKIDRNDVYTPDTAPAEQIGTIRPSAQH